MDSPDARGSTLGASTAPALSFEEQKQQTDKELLEISKRAELRQAQAHKVEMDKAKVALSDKKSLSVEMPCDSIRRLLATGLGSAKAASDLSCPVDDKSSRTVCLGADWTCDSPDSFGVTVLNDMFEAVHGLRTAAETYGLHLPPSTRMIFHLARVDFGGSGLTPADFAAPVVSVKAMASVVHPALKLGSVPPEITEETTIGRQQAA